MSKVYLSLGSNLGNREQQLKQAIDEISKQIGNVISQSAFYVTQPWGFQSEHAFLNAAICCETALSPIEVLHASQKIEILLGRAHKSIDRHYVDRSIDIDVLLYDQLQLASEELTIPHPLMHERMFVLEPLNEIAPDAWHPVLHKTISELYKDLLGS